MAKTGTKTRRDAPKKARSRGRVEVKVVTKKAVASPPSPARADARALTLSRRACIALSLDPDFLPDTHMHAIMEEVGVADPWSYLRHSESEEARTLVRLRATLSAGERDAVTIDHYIASAKVDFHKVLGAISEQVSRIESSKAAIKIAVAAPKMVTAAAIWGGTYDGHADRKMILQSSGVAPVPKTSVTNVSFRDSIIDQRRQLAVGQVNVHVPTLEEVVRDVDSTVYESKPDPRDAGPEKTLPTEAVTESESESESDGGER